MQSKADISITGAANVNYTSVNSSTSFEFMGSSSSAEFVTFETYTTTSPNVVTTNTTLYNTLNTDNKFKDMGRDLLLVPALLTNLFPGDVYFDIEGSKNSSTYEALLIPPCCSIVDVSLFAKPTIDSDSNYSVLFNKKIDKSGYFLTGSYQQIKSSRPSILPTSENLMTGCISCVNTVDRDKMTEKYARLGLGFEKLINSNYSLYAQIAYTQMYLEYVINSSTLTLPMPKLAQSFEGAINTVGVKIYPYKDFTIDINRDIFNLNGANAPDKNNVKFIHKVNSNLSIGFGYSNSEYIDTYSNVKNNEKSLLMRMNF